MEDPAEKVCVRAYVRAFVENDPMHQLLLTLEARQGLKQASHRLTD